MRAPRLLILLPLLSAACGGSDGDDTFTPVGTSGASGAAGSATAGSGTSGSGTAGSGTSGSGTAGSGTSGSGTAGSGTSGSGTAGSGTSGSGTAGSGTSGSGTAGTGPCLPKVEKAEAAPLDLVFLVDRSGSTQDMGKWASLSAALGAFAKKGTSAGLGVSLTYFPTPPAVPPVIPPSCMTDTDCGAYGPCLPLINMCSGALSAGDSCVASDYEKPVLGVAVLPGAEPAFSQSLVSTMPDGGTPTTPALAGVHAYALSWNLANPTHAVRVVLATDGEPTGCGGNMLADAVAVTKAGYETHGIRTVVIGIGGMLAALDQIAVAGGSKKAVLVDAGAQAAAEIEKAVNGAGAQRACVFAPPPPGAAVVLTTGAKKSTIASVTTAGPCTGAGYKLDDPGTPSRLELCDVTCDALLAASGTLTYESPCE